VPGYHPDTNPNRQRISYSNIDVDADSIGDRNADIDADRNDDFDGDRNGHIDADRDPNQHPNIDAVRNSDSRSSRHRR
jgi:hypothetical protein